MLISAHSAATTAKATTAKATTAKATTARATTRAGTNKPTNNGVTVIAGLGSVLSNLFFRPASLPQGLPEGVTFPLGGLMVTFKTAPNSVTSFDVILPCSAGINGLFLLAPPPAVEFTPLDETGAVDVGMITEGAYAGLCAFNVYVQDNGRGDSNPAPGSVSVYLGLGINGNTSA